MSSLTVYKASAGSGKTFTLTLEYIKFLIRHPESYKSILAVTFTNKATDEMKNRILSTLYGISYNLGDSSEYLKKIKEECCIDEERIMDTAKVALSMLIHNYDNFHVETIDTFFQSVLRNLAKELDLTANLKIELNDIAVEEQAVDMLVNELNRKSPLFIWLLQFIMESIDDNKEWNIIKSVKTFGKMIFNDTYRMESKRLNNVLSEKGFTTEYKKEIVNLKCNSHKDLDSIRNTFFEYIENHGIEREDFSGGLGRGIHKYFDKLSGNDLNDKLFMPKTVCAHMADEEKWAPKKSKKHDLIVSAARDFLIPLLKRAEEKRRSAQYVITSANATLQNFNNLRLLNYIEAKVRELNAEANRFLLSDTQQLLGMMINDSDSPFIFEKIGARLSHIMIDEFQDTSTIQWKNFMILLNECMSRCDGEGDSVNNLIVGDIKQSIYRWRSGDWTLLDNIKNYFPTRNVDIRELKVNYRSLRNIVDFNNCFFSNAIKNEFEREKDIDLNEAKRILSAYSDVIQNTNKDKKEGLVNIKLLSKKDFDESMLEEIENCINEMINVHNVQQSDIAILLRTNSKMQIIADYFTKKCPSIKIVSNEAFMLDHSKAVNTIIAALKYMYDGNNKIQKACLIKHYQLGVLNNTLTDNELFRDIDDNNLLPQFFVENQEELRKLPLYDLVEKLMAIFSIDNMQNESAYICAFVDYLSAFLNDMSAGVNEFLELWDDSLHRKTIQTDSINGVRMLTIHQSKGLQYDNVIIPYCNWQMENHNIKSYIWCRPKISPFDKLPIIPIEYRSNLSESIYADDYKEEHLQNTIDNLNLLYVAFTRAKKNLFIIGKRDSANSRSMLIQECLGNVSTELQGSTLDGIEGEDDIVFNFGSFASSEKKEDAETKNVFLKTYKQLDIKLSTHEIPVVFRQSNKSKDFISENKDDGNSEREYIKVGNILHLVFSNIKTQDDIPHVLNQFEADGVLYGEGLDRNKLEDMLHNYLSSDKMVADWFSPHWELYNECTILYKDTNGNIVEKRPDRVMKGHDNIVVIDFKFGKINNKYIKQVNSYINLLHGMGYKKVKGYIWYVNRNKITEVQ